MYEAKDILNWFIMRLDEQAGSTITPLKAQKLLYYAQAWFLALYDERLINDNFEAWAHGPVIRNMYYGLNEFGYSPVPSDANYLLDAVEIKDERANNLLPQIEEIYGVYDAKYLEELTHQETPWIEARKGYAPEEKCTKLISNDTMKNYYRELQKK